MFNKEFFEKIIKMELSERELLCLKADKLEYDLDNAFEKYYSLENILKAINNCENKIISVPYLAHWANLLKS